MLSGANVPAPAEDVLNENPSIVALGKKGPETILKISKMFQAFCSGLFPETGPKIKKNQPEIMNHQENLAKPSQNQ